MKIIDNVPIIIIFAALLINIVMGVNNDISFSVLMIRCIVVTIVFGIFGYMLTETIRNIMECNRINKLNQQKCDTTDNTEEKLNIAQSNPNIDIKVPPPDVKELLNIDYDKDDGFIEVNPADMGKYN